MEHLTGPPSNEKILYTEWYRAKVISYVPKQKKKKQKVPTYIYTGRRTTRIFDSRRVDRPVKSLATPVLYDS